MKTIESRLRDLNELAEEYNSPWLRETVCSLEQAQLYLESAIQDIDDSIRGYSPKVMVSTNFISAVDNLEAAQIEIATLNKDLDIVKVQALHIRYQNHLLLEAIK